jgi:DNA invertase Pin-like site-specific DNA recombinase
MSCKVIAYFRVSTKKQGIDGLGMDGQRAAVEQYAKQNGCRTLAAYTEVESGKRSDRPELAKALAHAKSAKAILVVAKLDRLSRNVAFLSALMESGVEFICGDNPNATRLTIHILAAVAEDEARRISERTKTALAAAKRRGVKLGSARTGHWKGREDRRQVGAAKGAKVAAIARHEDAKQANALVLQVIAHMRGQAKTWEQIADELNAQGHETRRGNPWTSATVWQVANRTAAKN